MPPSLLCIASINSASLSSYSFTVLRLSVAAYYISRACFSSKALMRSSSDSFICFSMSCYFFFFCDSTALLSSSYACSQVQSCCCCALSSSAPPGSFTRNAELVPIMTRSLCASSVASVTLTPFINRYSLHAGSEPGTRNSLPPAPPYSLFSKVQWLALTPRPFRMISGTGVPFLRPTCVISFDSW